MKKILMLLSMVAVVLTVGSLSSCKDTDDDLYNDLNSKLINENSTLRELLEAQKRDLQAQIDLLKNHIDNCDCDRKFNELRDQIAALRTELTNLINNKADQSEIARLEQMINNLIAQIPATCDCGVKWESLKEELKGINAAIGQNSSDIAALTEKLNTAITNIENNINEVQNIKNMLESLTFSDPTDPTSPATSNLQTIITKINEILTKHDGDINNLTLSINQINEDLSGILGRLKALEDWMNAYQAYDDQWIKDAINNINASLESFALKSDLQEVQNKLTAAEARIAANEEWIENHKTWVKSLTDAYGDDLKGLIAGLATEETLNTKIEETMTTLRAEAQALKDEAVELAKQYTDSVAAALGERIDVLETTVGQLEDAFKEADAELQQQITQLKNQVSEIEDKLSEMQAAIDALKNDLAKLVTSINVNGAVNEITGMGAAPLDMRSNILAAWYGKTTDPVAFPDEDAAKLAGFNDFYVVYGGKTLVARDGEEGNAGKIYITLNPFDKDFTGVLPKLVNSQADASAITLSPLKYSNDVLSFGYSRAGSDNGFYEAAATLKADDVANVKANVDLSAMKSIAKDVLTPRNGIDLTNVFSTIYKNMQNVLPALAVKIEPSDKNSAIISQYGVAATAVPALGYGFMKDYTLPRRYYINLGLPEEIQMNIKYSNATVSVNGEGKNVIVVEYKYPLHIDSEGNVDEYKTETVEINLETFVSSINGQIEGNVDDLINEIRDQVNDQFKDLLTNGNKIIKRVNNLLDRAYNFVENINSKLQPVLLFDARGNGDTDYHLFSEVVYGPTVFNMSGDEGVMVLHPTSFSAELLAPAYKKWVAVTNVYADNSGTTEASNKAEIMDYANNSENAFAMNAVLDGYIHSVAMPVKSSFKNKVLEITYCAMDYHGTVVTNKYYVTIK